MTEIALPRTRNYFQIFIASLTPLPIMLFLLGRSNDFGSIKLLFISLVCLVSFIFWFKNGTKPAARIIGDTLFIRDGAFSNVSIVKGKVQSMRYETFHKRDNPRNRTGNKIEMHLLVVKMSGFEEWSISITDMVELGDNMRLFNFIKNNFYDLTLIRKPS